MGISINTRQAYSEVAEFLNVISLVNRNQIPLYLIQFFNNEKDENYIKGINPNTPIKEQGLKEETLAIIAWLNLEYICQDENEKLRLKGIYAKNEEKLEGILGVKFVPEEVFKPKDKILPSISCVKDDETIIKKIINKIKKILLNNVKR